MRVERREVPTGAGRDPPPERRELKRLREVAQGEAVLGELRLKPGPVAPAWIRADSDTGSTSSTRSSALTSIVTTPGEAARRSAASTPPTTLVPPPNGITAAPAASAHSSASASSSLGARAHDHIGRVIEASAKRPHDVAVGTAVRVKRALVGVGETDLSERRRRRQAGRRQRDLGERHGLRGLGRAEPESLREERARAAQFLVGRLLVLIPPAPVFQSTRHGGRLPGNALFTVRFHQLRVEVRELGACRIFEPR